MKERPILLSGPDVRAVLEGSLTTIRRGIPPRWASEDTKRLWVRETWGLHAHFDTTHWARHSLKRYVPDDILATWSVAYRADAVSEGAYWRPSIHLPRWASRITLEITDIRVERTKDTAPNPWVWVIDFKRV